MSNRFLIYRIKPSDVKKVKKKSFFFFCIFFFKVEAIQTNQNKWACTGLYMAYYAFLSLTVIYLNYLLQLNAWTKCR